MDIDELRQNWNRMNLRVERLEEDNWLLRRERDMMGKVSMQSRLLRQCTVRTILSFVAIPILVPQLLTIFGCPLWYTLMYAVAFLIFGFMNNNERLMVKSIDLNTMPVSEVMRRVQGIEQLRRHNMITGYIIAAIVLIPLFYFIYRINDRALIIGAWIGLVAGLSCGFFIKKRSDEMLKRIRENDISD